MNLLINIRFDDLYCRYQLKCDYDTDLFSDNDVECEVDGGIFDNAEEFECPVNTRTCTIECDWQKIYEKVPASTYKQIYRILNYWQASE